MNTVVIAEKPSVARDIAKVLGARRRAEGYLHGDGWVVTWAVGHLVALAEPHQIDPRWKRWQRATLPILPNEWPLVVLERTRDQFALIRRMLASPKIGEVVCATDAGREGELIFRYAYEAADCRKPVRRLWISSLTPAAIRRGFAGLRPGAEFDALADAARGRSRADWLVGMNLTRAVTLVHSRQRGDLLTVGRVQTPTLAMVVERERQIRAFVPEPYTEIVARFGLGDGSSSDAPSSDGAASPEPSYEGTWFRGDTPSQDAKRIFTERQPADDVEAILERTRSGKARIESIRDEEKRMASPRLYDLTELQRHANRLWGWSAKQTLKIAQVLYEQKKLISYPRTDSRHLSHDIAETLPAVVAAIRAPYEEHLAEGTGERPLGRRFVDDAKVGDHHAILPTDVDASRVTLTADEQRLYDLVCRRLLQAWHDDWITGLSHVVTRIDGVAARASDATDDQGSDAETTDAADDTTDGTAIVDRFHSLGKRMVQAGWKVLDLELPSSKRRKAKATEANLPDGLIVDLEPSIDEVRADAKQTRPPKRYTEATLLSAMETAGRTLDDEELSRAMKDSGLGTPATRAETIETLLGRQYMVRRAKSLHPTATGERLIDAVPEAVRSPALTGEWEARLARIQRGEEALAGFQNEIERFVGEAVAGVLGGEPAPLSAPATSSGRPVDHPSGATGSSDAPPLDAYGDVGFDTAEGP
ncbi:MAG: DNA topoisomerase, partial [Acidobacteriota bacterium]